MNCTKFKIFGSTKMPIYVYLYAWEFNNLIKMSKGKFSGLELCNKILDLYKKNVKQVKMSNRLELRTNTNSLIIQKYSQWYFST